MADYFVDGSAVQEGNGDYFVDGSSFSGIPTQYPILKIHDGAAVRELSVVAEADAPAGMGGVLKIRKGGVTYAIFLVETTDTYASRVRIKTSTGVKSIRLKV